MRMLRLFGVLAALLPGLALAAPSPPPSADSRPVAPLSFALPQDDEPRHGDRVRMMVIQAILAPGESLPENARSALRYIYVKSGRLQVSNLVTGDRQDVEAGEFAVESAGQWHTGLAVGLEPAEILLIEQAPAEL